MKKKYIVDISYEIEVDEEQWKPILSSNGNINYFQNKSQFNKTLELTDLLVKEVVYTPTQTTDYHKEEEVADITVKHMFTFITPV